MSNVFQKSEPTRTQLIPDDLVIKNEYEDTRLALCLVDHDDTRLPIVDLGRLPSVPVPLLSTALTTPHVGRIKHSPSMDSCVQAYAMAEQTGAFILFFSTGDCLNLISSLPQ
jgi:hypothetical protein